MDYVIECLYWCHPVLVLWETGVHKLFQFGLAYHKVHKTCSFRNCIFCVIGHAVTAKVANQFSCMYVTYAYKSEAKQGTEKIRRIRIVHGEGNVNVSGVQGAGYAPGYASGNFSKFSKFFRNLAPGVASGYAPGVLNYVLFALPWPAILCNYIYLKYLSHKDEKDSEI
ncbi:hypothetical protein T07_12632 [Trichinella nelsoni]|uniref:Uncharacterized protein n=1 Tax=Trichinella nelsoni TaxID=6336 RepID=A0A0V0RQD8_9BILA|nr:hypothetical protein T07_12632 [Trichinella nelsoni]